MTSAIHQGDHRPTEDKVESCGICLESSWLLHYFRCRATIRQICTNCVLKNSAGSFCPVCFVVFDEDRFPAPHTRVICSNCPSIAHSSCVVGSTTAAAYTCSSCSNPSFVFFKASGDSAKAIEGNSAKAVLAAANLASLSMNKAAMLARFEAERRVKEATVAKQKAKAAIESLLCLQAKEKESNGDSGKRGSKKAKVAN